MMTTRRKTTTMMTVKMVSVLALYFALSTYSLLACLLEKLDTLHRRQYHVNPVF
jgi:hypothetical protein